MRPYADERPWVLALPLALAALLAGLAFLLESRRDLGAGILRPRAGRHGGSAHASGPFSLGGPLSLRGPLSLLWRLERGSLLGWGISLAISGLAIGSLATQAAEAMGASGGITDVLTRLGGSAEHLTESFLAAMAGLLVPVLTLAPLGVLSGARAEEVQGRAAPLLATAVGRTRWLLSAVALELSSGVVLTFLALALMGLAVPADGGASRIGPLLMSALALLPGLALTVGIGTLLLGWAPGLLPLAQVLIGWSIFAAWVGALLDLPGWLIRATPWGRLPHLPGGAAGSGEWTAVVVETVLALVLIIVGAVGFRRRDLVS